MQIKVDNKQINQAQLVVDTKTGEVKAKGNIALPYESHQILSGNAKVKANQSDLVFITLAEALRIQGIVCQQVVVFPGEVEDLLLCLVNPTTAQVMIGKDDVVAIVKGLTVTKQGPVKKTKDDELLKDDEESSELSEDNKPED